VKTAIKNIPYLNDKDMNFVSVIFEIPLSANGNSHARRIGTLESLFFPFYPNNYVFDRILK